MNAKLRLACLISGGGRTLLNIADRIDDGSLKASIELVIASRRNILGVEKSRARGFNTLIVLRKDFASDKAMHDAITKQIVERNIDLVCMCGYLRPMRIDEPLRWKVINIHPALLPEFGGKGMHGEHVHQAVLAAKKAMSGCTVHFVDDIYDHGPIILQRTCPVLPNDTADSLAVRVFEQECIAYPEAIRMFGEGQLRVVDGRVVIDPRHLP